MRLFRARILRDPTQSFRDAMDMGIHREKRLLEAEKQDDGCRLGSHARNPRQPLHGFVRRHLPQEIKFDFAPFFGDMLQSLLDTRGFLL